MIAILLQKLLTDNLSGNKTVSITIDRKIPETTVAIKTSASMMLYGIGNLQDAGFALYISVGNRSGLGQQILATLSQDDLLEPFKTFDGKGSTIYVADFKSDVAAIIRKVEEVMTRLGPFATQADTDLDISRTDDTFTLG